MPNVDSYDLGDLMLMPQRNHIGVKNLLTIVNAEISCAICIKEINTVNYISSNGADELILRDSITP